MANDEPEDWRDAWLRENRERGREGAREVAGEAARVLLKWMLGSLALLTIILVVFALIDANR